MGLKPRGGMSRVSAEFELLIAEIKLEYRRAGKRPPSNEEITRMLTQSIKRKGVLQGEFISFK